MNLTCSQRFARTSRRPWQVIGHWLHRHMARVMPALLVASSAWALPAQAAFEVEGSLRVATASTALRGDCPVAYQRFSGVEHLAADDAHPRRASAFDFVGPGPQVWVHGVSTYFINREERAYDRLRISLKFWDHHSGNELAVFEDATPAGLLHVNLAGPFILEADTAYEVVTTLPKPLQINAFESVGVSVQILANTNGGPLTEQPGLLVAYDTGTEPALGTPLQHYRGEAGGVGAFEFDSSHATDQPLAIAFLGRSLRHVQCTQWEDPVYHIVEEFDDLPAFARRWTLYQNQGRFPHGTPGRLSLATSVSSANRFPYVHSEGSALPPHGEFSVRWLGRFDNLGHFGTGSMVISRGAPANGAPANHDGALVWTWQDVNGFQLWARTAPTVTEPLLVIPVTDGGMHDVEVCWLDQHVEVWFNSQLIAQVPHDGFPRPDRLWMGNHAHFVQSHNWSRVELHSLRVRAPYTEVIFSDGFEW